HDGDRAADRRDRRRAWSRSHRVPPAQRAEDRDEEHSGCDPDRLVARRGGPGKSPRPRAVERPRRAQAGVRRPTSRKILRRRFRMHSMALWQWAEASFSKVELAPDGRITVSSSGAEIGTGMSSGQAVACVRWLGRPADALEVAVTGWSDLPVETSGD